MGQIEVENADVLNGLCTECFCEETGQEYDSPFGEYFTGVSKGLDLARDWRPSQDGFQFRYYGSEGIINSSLNKLLKLGLQKIANVGYKTIHA